MLLHALEDPALDALLAEVSRSFYLTLAVLPRSVRRQFSLAYLLARSADTVADSLDIAAQERLALLADLRAWCSAEPASEAPGATSVERWRRAAQTGRLPSGERSLLGQTTTLLVALRGLRAADRERIARVLGELLQGMERDLERIETSRWPLASSRELDEHCYLAAGCVGRFWTEMMAAHIPRAAHLATPELIERGIRLGKALQMVNVLRDAPADLERGRCYFPAPLLEHHGVTIEDLQDPARRARARPVLFDLLRVAADHFDAAWPYVQATPAACPRLRLACIWPVWLGLGTLVRLAAMPDPFDPGVFCRLDRSYAYLVMAESSALVMLDPLLAHAHGRRRLALTRALRLG